MKWLNHELHIKPVDTFIDPIRPVNRAIITHGHSDHARAGHNHVLATPQTIEIMKGRYGPNCANNFQPLNYGKPLRFGGVEITLFPAGHILGSAQVCVEYQGQRVVVTGDYKIVADNSAQCFELVRCDLLVTEATFGLPVFQHPQPAEEIGKLLTSLAANSDRPHLVGAYALGKSQRIIKLLREVGYAEPIYLHGAQAKICEYYQSQGVNLGCLKKVSHNENENFCGKVVIAPPSATCDRWSQRFQNPLICRASGWMTVKQRAKKSGVELPLIISDHADWNELTQTIRETEAETVWVTHGREDAVVHWCQLRGLNAQPLFIQGREEEMSE